MKIREVKQIKRPATIRQDKADSGCCSDSATSPSSCCSDNSKKADAAPCCGPATVITGGTISEKVPGFIKWLESPAGRVPQISTKLTLSDHIGACKARWAIGRMSYIVPPGLYAIGTPGADSPVLVTANYKMSYDILRRNLSGRNMWLLVLETFGVNVWCAAGKGSFGTDELVSRINRSGLHSVVKHRRLLLPILGAPGVAAHQVAKRTGFSVCYATIRAEDLPEFLDHNMTTTPGMREITFTTYERLVLVPVEIVLTLRSIAIFGGAIFLSAFAAYSFPTAAIAFAAYVGAVLTGVAITPVLLPWIPGRSFAIKGALAGFCWLAVIFLSADGKNWGVMTTMAALLSLPAISAFYALNFTGCTTYTSRSGVKKEMRLGIPSIGIAVAASIVLFVAARFI